MRARLLGSLPKKLKKQPSILTHRLNQDCLEKFFSQLRTRGGLHDHPSSLNALYRIKMILLGKNPGMVHTHSNVVTSIGTEKEEYLLASAMKQAKIGNITIEKPENILEDVADSSSSSSSTSWDMSKNGLRKRWITLYRTLLGQKASEGPSLS
ncbi:hypothetical protein NQ314_007838 [Rhamnusium bicolor]|uniref:Transposable element P transposase-like RNase H C-terminal domain-containing protein n=1 Tax=Rhamnusium bicolor TaxID=1586634 RepID=A0AAV8YJB5_9CUCU|nr:hypothetical protein NQ314_007838 [Rhamnusium bicolor]